jgi:hypothetical protein
MEPQSNAMHAPGEAVRARGVRRAPRAC